MWVARDKNDELYLYTIVKPWRCEGYYWVNYEDAHNKMNEHKTLIDSSLFPNLKWEDGPIEVELDTLVQVHKDEHSNLDNVFKELSETHNPNKALKLCKSLENKCFKKTVYDKHRNKYIEFFIKIYEIKAIDGYVIGITNKACRTVGYGTWKEEDRYEFTCKDKSEYILWAEGTHSPFYTYNDLVMIEISNEEFITEIKRLMNEYLEKEIINN